MIMKIQSTFKFPVTVAGKVYKAAKNPWQIGQPLPEPKDGITYLVNVINFNANKDSRNDLCMLSPENVKRNEKGHAVEYSGFIFS